VNYPNVTLDSLQTETRLTILAKNDPEIARNIDSIITKLSAGVVSKISKVRHEYAYYVIDINKKMPKDLLDALNNIDDVYKTRVIN
jgi:hypothetical protein